MRKALIVRVPRRWCSVSRFATVAAGFTQKCSAQYTRAALVLRRTKVLSDDGNAEVLAVITGDAATTALVRSGTGDGPWASASIVADGRTCQAMIGGPKATAIRLCTLILARRGVVQVRVLSSSVLG